VRRAAFVFVIALATMVPTIGRGAAVCPAGHVADGNDCDWTGAPTFLSGTAVVDRGEFIASDYVHDDSGANVDGFRSGDLDPGNPVTGMEWPNLRNPASPRNGSTGDNLIGRMRWTGDFGYPPSQPTTDPFTYQDVADILEFRTAVDRGALHYIVRLGALVNASDTVIGIGIDADRNAATGAASFPLGSNLKEQLGFEYAITLWGTGGEITDYTQHPARTTPVTVHANTTKNFVEADVPIPPGAQLDVWRTYAAAGLWSGTGWAMPAPTTTRSFAPGALLTAPWIFDLAFVADEPNTWWRDTTQADDLAKHDIAQDHADIDMTELARGASGARPRPTGLIDFQYPAVPLGPGEGQEWNSGGLGSINYIYRGAVQPGMVFLPSSYYTNPHPRRFMFFFHCLNCNQNIWPLGIEDSATPGQQHIHDGTLGTTHIQAIADALDTLVGGSLQRGEGGPSTYGSIIGERDLLDVYRFISSHYDIDPNRIVFSGMSMGGSTTNTMMTLHPDMIAAAVSHSAASSPARLQNIRNVFYMQVTGDTGLDGTAAVTGRQLASNLTSMNYQHMYLEYLGRAHDFNLVYDSLPIVQALVHDRVRDPNPARVTYELDASTESPALGVVHDRAYWVSGLQLANGATSGTVDATALPLSFKLPREVSHLQGHFLNLESGNGAYVSWSMYDTDLTGHGLQDFESGWTPGPDVAVTNTQLPLPANAGTNGFLLTTSSFAAQTLDLGRMGITTTAPVTGAITAGNATVLTLLGNFAGVHQVLLDGHAVAVNGTVNGVTISIPAGTHTLVA